MLELYHSWDSFCSFKVRLCLEEKGLDWTGHHLDLMKFENLRPDYMTVNPNGLVPTLIDDGTVIVESTIINEYLDDAYPSAPLRPEDARAKARMRLWLYDSEAIAHPGVNTASYNPRHAPRLGRFSKEQLMETVSGHPDRNTRIRMMKRAEHGVPARVVLAAAIVAYESPADPTATR